MRSPTLRGEGTQARHRQSPALCSQLLPEDSQRGMGLTCVWQLTPGEEGSCLCKGLEQRAKQTAEEEEEVGAA